MNRQRFAFVLVAGTMAVVLAPPAITAAADALQQLLLGEEAFKQGKFTAAIERLQSALKDSEPEALDAGLKNRCLLLLSQAYGESGRIDEALQKAGEYQRRLEGLPDSSFGFRRQMMRQNGIRMGRWALRLKRYDDAESLLRAATLLPGPAAPVEDLAIATGLAVVATERRRAEAGSRWDNAIRGLALVQSFAPKEAAALRDSLADLASYRPRETVPILELLALRWEADPRADKSLPSLLEALASAQRGAGLWSGSIETTRKRVALLIRQHGGDESLVWPSLVSQGYSYVSAKRYEEAYPLLAVCFERRPADYGVRMARLANTLGVAEQAIGFYAKALEHFRFALTVPASNAAVDQADRTAYEFNVASVLTAMGRYHDAVVAYEQALSTCRGTLHADDSTRQWLEPRVLLGLATVYKSQRQWDRAVECCTKSLELVKRFQPTNSAELAAHYAALAGLDMAKGSLEDAARWAVRANELCQARGLDDLPVGVASRHQLAMVHARQGRIADADRIYRDLLGIYERTGDVQNQMRIFNELGRLAALREQWDVAESRYRRASELGDAIQAFPVVQFIALTNLAAIRYRGGECDEAVNLVRRAVKKAETARIMTSGAEDERAEFFAQFAVAFDLLVGWNVKRGQIGQAFAEAEQARNRTFDDQMQLAGVDVRKTLPGAEHSVLLQREQSLDLRLSTLKAAMARDVGQRSRSTSEFLERELVSAQQEYADVWREIRDASPLYREILARGSKLVTLADVRRILGRDKAMLFYYLGDRDSYLMIIAPGREPLVVTLTVPASATQPNRTSQPSETVPLTRSLADTLVRRYLLLLRRKDGPLPQRSLGAPVPGPDAEPTEDHSLVLGQCLLPTAARECLAAAQPGQVVVVPDGALHQLPFEALLLPGAAGPSYAIHSLPPMSYAPSATILAALQSRPATPLSPNGRILSVGQLDYRRSLPAKPASFPAATRSLFVDRGGELGALPNTGAECDRIAKAFGEQRVKPLKGPAATERAVRAELPGCVFLHFATHGLSERSLGNLFGALALTPPDESSTLDNDGFLELHEIHGLRLQGCQLVVLSACQTNVGTDRPLEAASTLTQAFLVAGAIRVVSSLWRVDDASTAELIGTFFDELAKSSRDGDSFHFARALRDARLRVIKRHDCSHPYHWAPFVLVGPPDAMSRSDRLHQ